MNGQDLPHSIFYDNISGKQSNARDCQSSSDSDCQATTYAIGGRTFSAILGVANSSPSSREIAVAHWHISLGGVVVRSGTYTANGAPLPMSASVTGGHSLELMVGTDDPGVSESINVVWGNAQLG